MTQPRVHNRHHRGAPTDAVYVGRGTLWGNPFQIGKHGNRAQVLTKFAKFVLSDATLIELAKTKLANRDLVCSCAPQDCHADLWLAIANSLPLPTWATDEPSNGSPQQPSLAGW